LASFKAGVSSERRQRLDRERPRLERRSNGPAHAPLATGRAAYDSLSTVSRIVKLLKVMKVQLDMRSKKCR
jgi:hypothetical protein